MALRFEPSRFFLKGKGLTLLGSKRKAINTLEVRAAIAVTNIKTKQLISLFYMGVT